MSRTRIPLSRQDEQARLMKERLEMSTAEIGLSVRTTNCLEERGIFTEAEEGAFERTASPPPHEASSTHTHAKRRAMHPRAGAGRALPG